MNQRIRELVVESGNGQMHDGRLYPHIGSRTEADWAKFAELIVLECVNAVMDGTKEGDHYAMRIEQHFNNGQGGILHFGVEE